MRRRPRPRIPRSTEPMRAPRRAAILAVLLAATGLAGPGVASAHDELLVQLDHLAQAEALAPRVPGPFLARAGDLHAAAGRRLEAESQWSKALLLIEQDRRPIPNRALQDLKRQFEAALSANATGAGR